MWQTLFSIFVTLGPYREVVYARFNNREPQSIYCWVPDMLRNPLPCGGGFKVELNQPQGDLNEDGCTE
jgi:hypothetical protein